MCSHDEVTPDYFVSGAKKYLTFPQTGLYFVCNKKNSAPINDFT